LAQGHDMWEDTRDLRQGKVRKVERGKTFGHNHANSLVGWLLSQVKQTSVNCIKLVTVHMDF
jgi:hypothetical protein